MSAKMAWAQFEVILEDCGLSEIMKQYELDDEGKAAVRTMLQAAYSAGYNQRDREDDETRH